MKLTIAVAFGVVGLISAAPAPGEWATFENMNDCGA